MGEDFAHGFKEIFHCSVQGENIADARYNAWTALQTAIGDSIPRHFWKLSQMQHDLTVGEDEDKKPIAFIVCEAIWVYDPESDGGKGAELTGPESPDPDGIKQPEELKTAN